jgi:hypothetical protein
MEADGGSAEVVDQYLTFANTHYYQQQRAERAGTRSQTVRRDENNRWGTFQAEITSVRFLDAAGNACREFEAGQPFTVEIRYHAHELIRKPVFGVATYREDGVHVNGTNTSLDRFIIDAIEGGGVVYYRVDHLPLLEGRYQVTAAIYDIGSNHAYDHHHRLYEFAVRQGSDTRGFEGMIRLPSRWQHDAGQSGEHRLAM